ncbi:hypothetical protein GCM10011571_22870 [Marinithermofilum abyssi]|uniref:Uncharacterized protein n=1 Tax=Marinithermofilum abyssi TaxID=1571185 RepID=A0A8J2VGD4_9BACL|nr:hypothetical protein [Marinithermofilum abyssi]GGE20324.1 hypothetical protein GCM10011571_22870 [Marinithermofilum abyssi]
MKETELVTLRITRDTADKLQQIAGHHDLDWELLAEDILQDRLNNGEFHRVRDILSQFSRTLNSVVKDAETLSHLSDEDKQLFLAAVTGALRASHMLVPKMVMELQHRRPEKRESHELASTGQ